MNELIRAATLDDVDPMMEMIRSVTPGLSTLLLDRPRLLERVERSHFAFTRRSESLGGEPYVLVMEQPATGQLIGTATVYGKSGGYEPIYVYRMVTTRHDCPQLNIYNQQRRTLHLERIYDGPTEIGSLFLLPDWRGGGRGRFLSLSRFLLLAQRPGRFGNRVIAEMRGRCDAQGVSPFWEAVMRPFFEIDFPAADALSTIAKSFIEELVPPFPIPLELLPAAAREVIGRVHPETEPAVKLLSDQGFKPTDMIDIFDGGPVLECQTQAIRAVAASRPGVARVVASERIAAGQTPLMLASLVGGFRSVLAPLDVEVVEPPGKAIYSIDAPTAALLGVSDGSPLWALVDDR
jgi:arginine N-succinyltransferase